MPATMLWISNNDPYRGQNEDFYNPNNWVDSAYASDPDAWADRRIPYRGESLIFDGSGTANCVGFGPTSVPPYDDEPPIIEDDFESLEIAATYPGTVSLQLGPVTLGTFQLKGGAIAQPNAQYVELSIYVRHSFDWTGGVLNSADSRGVVVMLPGAAAVVTPSGDGLRTGSTLVFSNGTVNGAVIGSTGTFAPGTVEFRNGAGVSIGGGLVAAPAAVTVDSGVVFTGRGVLQVGVGGEMTLGAAGGVVNSELPLYVSGGTAKIEADAAIFAGVRPNDPPTAPNVSLSGGNIYLRNGSTLAAPNAVILIAGSFTTVANAGSNVATVQTPVFQNFGATIRLAQQIAGGPLFGAGVLMCTGDVTWNGGVFEVGFYGLDNADLWKANGTFTVGPVVDGGPKVQLTRTGATQVNQDAQIVRGNGGLVGPAPAFSDVTPLAATYTFLYDAAPPTALRLKRTS